jgi:hypothetical protein
MKVLPDGSAIRASGEVDQRLRLGLRRITADPSIDRDFLLEDLAHKPGYNRQFEDWCGDISGRFLGLFAVVASYTGEPRPDLSSYVQEIAQLQKADGRFGVETPLEALDFAMIWGHGRLLIGLMDYWAATGDDTGLVVAKRLGDYYHQALPYWCSDEAVKHERNMFFCQGLEGMVALYRATGEERYLTVAQAMASNFRPHPWWHSHGYLSALRGALDLYEVTSDDHLLDFVQARAEEIAADHLLPDGTPPELFPWSLRDEGCTTADWLRLQLHLGTITGDARHFATAETALLNGLFGNQSSLGGFCHHQITPTSDPAASSDRARTDTSAAGAPLDNSFRLGYTGLGVDAWWCCAYHGPLGIYHAIRHTFGWDDAAVFVNLPIAARARISHPAGAVELEQQVDYAGPVRYRVQIHEAPPAGVILGLRVPEWAGDYSVERNGQDSPSQLVQGYARTKEPVLTGDIIELTVPVGVRVQPWRASRREQTLWYGPYLLVPEVTGGHVSALALPEPEQSGFVPLTRVTSPDRSWAIPPANFVAVGFGQEMGDHLDTIGASRPEVVRLRPLSEQTGLPVVPPTALGLPVFFIPPTGRLADELQRVSRAAAVLGPPVM